MDGQIPLAILVGTSEMVCSVDGIEHGGTSVSRGWRDRRSRAVLVGLK